MAREGALVVRLGREILRELSEVAAVGVHHVDVIRTVAIALERDALAVRTPRWTDVRGGAARELADRRRADRARVRGEQHDGEREVENAQRVHAAHGYAVPDAPADVSIRMHSRASKIAKPAINTPPRRSESCARIPSFAAVLATKALVTKK